MNLDGLYRMQGMLFSLMILGAFLKKKGIITDEGKRVIADLVIFVTLPCSIIESFEVELSMDILKSSAQALLVSCMVQVTCYILNMVLYPGVGEENKKVLKYATMASNAGILGNPVAEGIFGSMGLFYASFYLIPQRTAMWSLGMTYFTKAPDRKTLIKKICTHPCIVSVFIGFVLMLLQMQIPGFLGDTVHSLNKANTAVSMIFVGTVLAEADMKTMITPLSCYYAAVRLILIPALVWIGCLLFHIDTLVMGISVVLAAMPAASTTAILAAKYGGDEVFATKCVVFTTLLSMVSAPVWCMVLQR